MKKSLAAILTLLFLNLNLANASNGQNYYRYGDINTKLNKRAILEIAKQELRRLVIDKKIPNSWKSIPAKNIEKNHHTNSAGWIVSFNNKKIKKIKRQTINILLSERGDIIGSAYSNK